MKQLKYKDSQTVIAEKQVDDLLYLSFDLLDQADGVKHGFSTRFGGVSEGIFASMNLSFTRGDEEASVRENFRRMANALEVEEDSLVFSVQTHTSNVKVVTEEDKGKGIVKPIDYTDIDGLITNVPGLTLTTFYADCVPLFFYDPAQKVIGLSHSGWKGTVAKIGKKTVEKMTEVYGTNPKDVLAAVGPSICQDCYEVSEDVIEQFKDSFEKDVWDVLFYGKPNGKYQLNLWEANRQILKEAGINEKHIAVTNICTCCNGDKLFSHRASKGERGSLAAFMALE